MKAQLMEEEDQTFTPLYERVVVKRDEAKDTSRGGIFLPDSAKEQPKEATVISVGTGRVNEDGKVIPVHVKVGDRVRLASWGGTEITLNGRKLHIINEDDILGILS